MHPFSWSDFLIYIAPFFNIFLSKKYFKEELRKYPEWPISVALIQIPMLMMCIYLFGWLIFDYNLLPFVLFFSCFALGLHLYDYVRQVKHFEFKRYYLPASKILFIHLSGFFLGLALLRFFIYFVG